MSRWCPNDCPIRRLVHWHLSAQGQRIRPGVQGEDVDVAGVDGYTKYVEGFLSEFGAEFRNYLEGRMKDAKQKMLANK